MDIDKRQFPRATLICKITTVFGERLLVFNCHTENVGVGGLKVILEEKLHISTEVEVEVFLLDREKPLKCKGQIVWVKEMSPVGINPRFFDTGIKFIGMNSSDQEILKKIVDVLLSQEKDNI